MSEYEKLAQLIVIVALAVFAGWSVIRLFSSNLSSQAVLGRLLAINLIILGVGIGAGSYFGSGSFYPPIFAIISIGILTFFALLNPATHGDTETHSGGRLRDCDMRVAIAASVTTMYLALVGFGVWVESAGNTDPIAGDLMTSFSAVVGTVIAFYFGATAYVDAATAAASVKSTE